MSKIKGKNTKPEIILRSELFKQGLRFRIHKKDLPGKPDIVLLKYKTVIFVHGCFWHYHNECKEGRIPSTNSKYWSEKLQRNIENDKNNIIALQKHDWQVIVVWECEIEKQFKITLIKILNKIRQTHK